MSFLKQQQHSGQSMLPTVFLNPQEVNDIVDFLKALTDPCVKSRNCLSPWIPDDSLPDPDGLRLHGVDKNGNPL